jgi:hypothetical protein
MMATAVRSMLRMTPVALGKGKEVEAGEHEKASY